MRHDPPALELAAEEGGAPRLDFRLLANLSCPQSPQAAKAERRSEADAQWPILLENSAVEAGRYRWFNSAC